MRGTERGESGCEKMSASTKDKLSLLLMFAVGWLYKITSKLWGIQGSLRLGFHRPDLLSLLPLAWTALSPVTVPYMTPQVLSLPFPIWQSPTHLSEPSSGIDSFLRSLTPVSWKVSLPLSLPSVPAQSLSTPLLESLSHYV